MSGGIHIVTHCYAAELPQFAGFLKWQISSLVRHPCIQPVRLTVCRAKLDKAVSEVMAWGAGVMRDAGVRLSVLELDPGSLFRRSIGRNLAALDTKESICWFTDVDHYFGEGCLDRLWEIWHAIEPTPAMVWPKEIQIHKNHAIGDESWWEAMQCHDLAPEINPSQFSSKRYHRAIGGVQIVSGDFCRKLGYLNDHPKWQRPRGDGRPFRDFQDDVIFRRQAALVGDLVPIELPGLYRLRHTQTTY